MFAKFTGNFSKTLLLSVLAATSGAMSICADALPSLQSHSEIQEARNDFSQSAPRIHQRDEIDSIESERFIIIRTIDYGYRLIPERDDGVTLTPVFSDKNILGSFDLFFSSKSLRARVGQKIYCDCSGKHLEKNGRSLFFITNAVLFSE
jgi:hypothetical protein